MENPKGKTRQPVWRPFFYLLRITRIPWIWILIVTIIALGQSQIWLMFPDYLSRIIDGDTSSTTIGIMVAVIFGQGIVFGLIDAASTAANAAISLRFRESVWHRIVRLPMSFFEKQMHRDVINRVTEDTSLLSDTLANFPGGVIGTLYTLIGTFVMLSAYDVKLVLAELIIFPVVIGCAVLEGHLRYKKSDKVQKRRAEIVGYISEVLLHIPLVKAFVCEQKEEERGNAWIDELFRTNVRWEIYSNLANMLTSVANILNTVLVVVVGIVMTRNEELSIDEWVAFYFYATGLTACVSGFMSYWATLKESQGAVRRISMITVEPTENTVGSNTIPSGDIAVQSLSFRYEEKPVLENVSFTIGKGQITALVGPNGSGKSTLLRMLERFYPVGEGSITIDGTDINTLDLKAWRGCIGYVAQDTQMFSGTIRDNLVYGLDREVTDAELDEAAEAACIREFIVGLNNGYDTEVGDAGSKLSGGERQRIAIARAILRKADILLLDEVTANLDAQAEAVVNEAIRKVSVGCTTVIVAHNLDTIRDADQIVVMENGHVAGCGTHETLLAECGLYARLCSIDNEGV